MDETFRSPGTPYENERPSAPPAPQHARPSGAHAHPDLGADARSDASARPRPPGQQRVSGAEGLPAGGAADAQGPPVPPRPPLPPHPPESSQTPHSSQSPQSWQSPRSSQPSQSSSDDQRGPRRTGRGRARRGPGALLAAVAIVAAAVGGGTAYGIQELTGPDTVAAGSASPANAVPAGQKGTVSGVAAAVGPSIVEIKAATGSGTSTGSGVVISEDGEVVTNNHVIAGASSITVRTGDGTEYTAEVVGTDGSKDLALLRLRDASGLKAATLGDSDAVKVGDQVVAIGSPEGLTGTVTSGIVSALDRDVTVATEEGRGQQQWQQGEGWPFEFGGREFNGDTGGSTTTYQAIQTDASLNPGNSGGALIDMNGHVIGINSAMYSAGGSSSDAGSAGLGFAIPVNTLKADLPALRAGATG
ncbi:S1C family serine protease [Streptomyces sp. enrichment culture]|uniref:S1C family serine protease n=1 Tax=Streptomyces sp. enrichment culture TaxID=1795815 RepID=UPI003F5571BF